jgi:hypothetical protein
MEEGMELVAGALSARFQSADYGQKRSAFGSSDTIQKVGKSNEGKVGVVAQACDARSRIRSHHDK